MAEQKVALKITINAVNNAQRAFDAAIKSIGAVNNVINRLDALMKKAGTRTKFTSSAIRNMRNEMAIISKATEVASSSFDGLTVAAEMAEPRIRIASPPRIPDWART